MTLGLPAYFIGLPSLLPHLTIAWKSVNAFLHNSHSNLEPNDNLLSTNDNARTTLTTFAILSMFDRTVIEISINFWSVLFHILFNQKILGRLKNCLKHGMNNNVERNPFKIWYLEYPVFQGWDSFNEYDILILNVL